MNGESNEKTSEFLMELYKNMKMGSDSIVNISSKVGEGPLRNELTRQLDTYEKYSGEASKMLFSAGETPKEENIMSKVARNVGMTMNTLTDSSESHIAQMMIEGATMGVTENLKLIRRYEGKGVSEEAISLAKDTVSFMEDSVEHLKKYL